MQRGVNIFNTFDDPSVFTAPPRHGGVKAIDEIVRSYQNAIGGHDFLESDGAFLRAPQHP
jgi:hypothetical protein